MGVGVVVVAALLAAWVFLVARGEREAFPDRATPPGGASNLPTLGAERLGATQSAEATERVRPGMAWLRLRPVSNDLGKQILMPRLGVWGPRGTGEIDFATVQQAEEILVPTAPQIGGQRICMLAEGFAPCDVTDLVLQGGQHICVLEAAARFDVVLEDVSKVAADASVRLERERRGPAGRAQVVWPSAAHGSAYRFDLVPGTYRLAVDDDSVVIWSGAEPVIVGDLTTQRRTLVLAGLVAAAMLPTKAAIRKFYVDAYPAELIAVHEEQVRGVAQRLRAERDSALYIRFAATRSLAHRRLTHNVPVRLGAGDGAPTLHHVAFQPLDQLVAQEIRLDTSADAGRLKVSLVGPGGVRLDGVDVRVTNPSLGARDGLVAVLKSGGDWRSLAPGRYTLVPHLPDGVLLESRRVEAVIVPGGSIETLIPMNRDLVAAYLRIELEGAVVPEGASVRVKGEGIDAVYTSTKPERIRVWVPPTRLGIEVYVSEEAQTLVEIDFAVARQHTIKVASAVRGK